MFVAAIVLHLMRVFFTGAFRKPRELTWLIGLTMLFSALLEGYLGYSMVDDLLSGMGLAIGYGVALSVPVIGGNLALAIWGGPYPGTHAFESRMYIGHVFLLPLLIGTLLAVHLALVAARHHTQFRPRAGRARDGCSACPTFPGQAPRSLGLMLAVAAVLFAARRARADQPDLAVGPLRDRAEHQRRAARLVPGLADRRAAPGARLRRHRSATTRSCQTRSGAARCSRSSCWPCSSPTRGSSGA